MSSPQRIQQRRTKGWRKPEGAIAVGRGTRWGNPYTVGEWGLDRSLRLFRNTASGLWRGSDVGLDEPDDVFNRAYSLHNRWLKRIYGHPIEMARAELAGKDLMCWCPLDQPCHADVLLELANPKETM